MSSCPIAAVSGPSAPCPAPQKALTTRHTRSLAARTGSAFAALLLAGVAVLGLWGAEARNIEQALAVFKSNPTPELWAAPGHESSFSGLPQIEGVVRYSPAQQTASTRVPPVLGGSALGLGMEGRAPRKAPVVSLTAEQSRLARHISTEYRRAPDFSRELVHHAYQIAREAQVDPLLILAIISVESRFNPLAESPAGAQGLMQVLTRVHFAKFRPFGGIQAAFDPVANLKVGTAILRHYLQSHETVALALKAYVGASQAEHDFGYGAKVMAAREQLAEVVTLPQEAALPQGPVRMLPVVERGAVTQAQDNI